MDDEAPSPRRRPGHDDVRLDVTLEDEQGKYVTSRAPHLQVRIVSCRQVLAVLMRRQEWAARTLPNLPEFSSRAWYTNNSGRVESDRGRLRRRDVVTGERLLGRPARPHLSVRISIAAGCDSITP
ncbi:hypothetical protein MTO96_008320 [Rhipicephalus appendiculatus]